MTVSECPVCTFHIPASNLQQGDIINCPDCGARLRLAKAYPPIFEELPSE
ncbi:MAG: hypothetical protein QXN37_01515 [Candidatus Anstonellaceae archaeon]